LLSVSVDAIGNPLESLAVMVCLLTAALFDMPGRSTGLIGPAVTWPLRIASLQLLAVPLMDLRSLLYIDQPIPKIRTTIVKISKFTKTLKPF
jgi:hypothetical protein